MPSIPIGLSRDLPARRVMRAIAEGRDLAVWRSASGRLSAWDNRCPHRGMRLSHGFVRGEALACLYHGWQYGAETGRCQYIPAHPDLTPPETIGVQAHPAGEAGGLIWVAVSGPLDMPDPGAATAPLRSLNVEAAPGAVSGALASTALDGVLPASFVGRTVVRFTLDGLPMAAALQSLPCDQTGMHVLVTPEAGRAALTRLSRWCEEVRRVAEALAIGLPVRQESPA